MNAEPEPVIHMLERLLSGEIFDQLLALQNDTEKCNEFLKNN